MARFLAGLIILVSALLYHSGHVPQEGILFGFVLATFVLVVGLEERVERVRENKAQRVLEYKVSAIGLGNLQDLHMFEEWLMRLNDERWELVCILEPPTHTTGMHYAIFARPKLAGPHE